MMIANITSTGTDVVIYPEEVTLMIDLIDLMRVRGVKVESASDRVQMKGLYATLVALKDAMLDKWRKESAAELEAEGGEGSE